MSEPITQDDRDTLIEIYSLLGRWVKSGHDSTVLDLLDTIDDGNRNKSTVYATSKEAR